MSESVERPQPVTVGRARSRSGDRGGRAAGRRAARPLRRRRGRFWLGRVPAGLAEHLHPGVRWVQLALSGVDSWVGDPVMTSGPSSWRCAASTRRRSPSMRWPCCWPAPGTGRAARSTSWDRPDTRMFGGATVVIVGAGAIGRELIRMLEPFRCRVVAVNRTGTPVEGAAETLPVSRLDEACAMGEYVVLAAPATPDTHSLIGERQLTAMPREAWIVNVGRGPLIDTAALTTALAQGVVREPPSTSPSPSPARRPPALARATLPDHLPLGEPGGRAPVVAGRPGGREPGALREGRAPARAHRPPLGVLGQAVQ